MELALLVYAISLLSGIRSFLVLLLTASIVATAIFTMWKISETDEYSYYSEKENAKRVANGVMCVEWIKRCLWTTFTVGLILVFIPAEKTAYVMVGAYAAQKIAQDPKTEQIGNKVLTVINQTLDSYIEQGVEQATKPAK
jgi:hypothetical protein